MSYNLVEHLENIQDKEGYDSFMELPMKERKKLYFENREDIKKRIIDLSLEYSGFNEAMLFNKCRKHAVCFLRYHFYKMFVYQFGLSMSEVARFFNVTHATVWNAFQKYPVPELEIYLRIESEFNSFKTKIFHGII